MSRLYDAPARNSVSLTAIIAAVSIATFAVFGGLYLASLNSGSPTAAPEAVTQAPSSWVPPEERAAKSGATQQSPRSVEGQL